MGGGGCGVFLSWLIFATNFSEGTSFFVNGGGSGGALSFRRWTVEKIVSYLLNSKCIISYLK